MFNGLTLDDYSEWWDRVKPLLRINYVDIAKGQQYFMGLIKRGE